MFLGITLLIILILGLFPDFFSELFGETPKRPKPAKALPVMVRTDIPNLSDLTEEDRLVLSRAAKENISLTAPDFIPEDWTR